MKKKHYLIGAALLIVGVASVVFPPIKVETTGSTELKAEKIDFDKVGSFPSVIKKYDQKKWEEQSLKERFNGKWVVDTLDYGGTTLDIKFTGENTAKIEFSDYSIEELRIATFESNVTFYEEVNDTVYYGRFFWDAANKGFGTIIANKYGLHLVLTSTEGFGGAYYHINSGHYEFSRPSTPNLGYVLDHIQEKVKIHKYGYIPNEFITYYYKSTDGETIAKRYFNVFAEKIDENHGEEDVTYSGYEVSRKGILKVLKTKNKFEREQVLSFPVMKGKKWESGKTTREYIDTDYEIVPGLKDVVVVKVGKSEYEYYHKNFGLIGWGEGKGEKHKPTYLLNRAWEY